MNEPIAPVGEVVDVRPIEGSFRDPRARVFERGDAILRAFDERGAADLAALRATKFFRRGQAEGSIVATTDASAGDAADLLAGQWHTVVAHERVPVVAYPYEWSFTMLQDAALLQLQLLQEGLAEGIGCKDGTPYNVQFVGARPTFIDIGSFAPVGADAWPGYRQFCQMFLYPLLLEAHVGVSFAPWMRGSLEGIAPADAARLLRGRSRFHRGVLSHVTLQALAARRYEGRTDPASSLMADAGTNVEVTAALVGRLMRMVEELQPPGDETAWTGYHERGHYAGRSLDEKDRFVHEVLDQASPQVVVDLGCNDGRYAEIAADHAELVVAVDADREVIDGLYRRLRPRAGRITPLISDLADPSPSLGWGLAERTSLDRRIDPDVVLSLALIHHLVIGRNIPIGGYLDALAALAPRVVLEIPHRDDPMVATLLGHKDAGIHDDYDITTIRRAIEERFTVRSSHILATATRTIFDLEVRSDR